MVACTESEDVLPSDTIPSTENESTVGLALAKFDTIDSYRINLDFEYQKHSERSGVTGSASYVLYQDPIIKAASLKDITNEIIFSIISYQEKAYYVYPNEDDYYATETYLEHLSIWDYQGFLLDVQDIEETYIDNNGLYLYTSTHNALEFFTRYPSLAKLRTAFFNYKNVNSSPDFTNVSVELNVVIDSTNNKLEYIHINYYDYLAEYYEDDQGEPYFTNATIKISFDDAAYPKENINFEDLIYDDCANYPSFEPIYHLVLGELSTTNLEYDSDVDLFEIIIDEFGHYIFEAEGVGTFMAIFSLDGSFYQWLSPSYSYALEPDTYYIRVVGNSEYGLGAASVKLTKE